MVRPNGSVIGRDSEAVGLGRDPVMFNRLCFNRPCVNSRHQDTAARPLLPNLCITPCAYNRYVAAPCITLSLQCSDHRPGGGAGAGAAAGGGASAAGACSWLGNGEPAAGAGAALGGFGFLGFTLFRTGLGGGPAGCNSATTGFGLTVAGSPWTSCTGMVTAWNRFMV